MSRALLLTLLLAGCGGGDDTDGLTLEERCGDPDGDGGDTGDVPGLIASWTGFIGQSFLENNCPSDAVPSSRLDFLEQPFDVEGSVPSAIVLTFADNPDLRLRGTAAPSGAWAMSGPIQQGDAVLYTAIGGLVYEDSTGRARWDGALFIGGDLNGDAEIDCEIRGDWKAFRSSGN